MAKALHPVSDPANWIGQEIASGEGWTHILTASEVTALRDMAKRLVPVLNGNPDKLLSMSKGQFDLGCFEDKLSEVFEGLKSGYGVALIRGLPIDEIPPLDRAAIYWGIGRHLGDATPNNPEGDMFGHVTDLGKSQSDPNSRGYQTRETMDYHCDQCDIVGLMCIRTAKEGGQSKVASSVAMYNSLLERHPDFVEALTEPLFWTKHGEHGEAESPYYQSPVFNFFNRRLCTAFGPKHIEKGYKLPDTPSAPDLLHDALRAAEEIAHEQRCEMVLQPGDMQFLNNYVIVHTRSGYIDDDDPAKKRLLWRLWLMNDKLRSRTAYASQWMNGVTAGRKRHRIRL